ncbi:MAG TPA: hypothetical protein VMF55_16410 [Solirubrobacterales bacterium]|nr:hypothetical protein [Solirubrobacterales bacterium]
MAARARERRRIVAGLLAALEDRDPAALRECDVIVAADLPPGTFEAHFDDLDACFDFACEAALDTLLGPVVASWSVPRPPARRLGDALAALLGSLAARPRLAELCLLHSPLRQPDRRTYRRLVGAVAELLLDVRAQPGTAGAGPGEKALARGLVGFIGAHLADRRTDGLERLQPRLLALLVPILELDESHPLDPFDSRFEVDTN